MTEKGCIADWSPHKVMASLRPHVRIAITRNARVHESETRGLRWSLEATRQRPTRQQQGIIRPVGFCRIYADFNAQIDPGSDNRPGQVLLERMGTLRDLCAARVRLRDGLILTLYSDSDATNDLEVDAVARWIGEPGARGGGYWVGEFDPRRFRDVPVTKERSVTEWFPCSECGCDLTTQIRLNGLSTDSRCGRCGTRVHLLIAAADET
jgi:hypothetical protein